MYRLSRASSAGRLDWRFAGVLLACAFAAFLLWGTPLVLPFRLFVTMIHELSHAAAAVLTGGQVLGIDINLNGSGVTYVRGGNAFLVASAGYLGSSIFGALLLIVARGQRLRLVLRVLAVGLVVSVVLAFRDLEGIVFALLIAGALWLVAARAAEWAVALLVYLLAVLNGLYAIHDVLVLVDISHTLPRAHSDAAILARLTGLPAVVWAVLWTALALVVQVWALRLALGSPAAPRLPERGLALKA